MFTSARWIWNDTNAQPDEFCDFKDKFFASGKTLLYISCDSDYTVFVNGKMCAFGQYPDFETHKVYDVVDISDNIGQGVNILAIKAWYYGENFQTYKKASAGLIYEVASDGRTVAASSEKTLSRLSRTYLSHRRKRITKQLGFSYYYDFSGRDGWQTGESEEVGGFSESSVVDKSYEFYPRPVRKTVMLDCADCALSKLSDTYYRVDLGRETVGFLDLEIYSSCRQKLIVSYGEHMTDGRVRRIIDDRDFSVTFIASAGINKWHDTFRRLGCRYLEIESEQPIDIKRATLRPVVYPLSEIPFCAGKGLRERIYRVCIDTLKLCIHDHYEDCPWREQALYALDSRNQMLCGYYAFGEFGMAKASLKLMALNAREDGLLSICSPAGVDLTIPSFSLHYFTEVDEYTEYSKDTTLAEDVFSVLEGILDAFFARMDNDGLVADFSGQGYWNFYEWADGLAGNLGNADPDGVKDLLLNALFVMALSHMSSICRRLGKPETRYLRAAEETRDSINRVFKTEEGYYAMYPDSKSYSELGNSLAILCGAADERSKKLIAERLTGENDWTKITLSMKCFIYDALLKCGAYKKYIMSDIDDVYGKMLASGATSVWETERGEEDFDGAGSLCHGWSAMPVYYYHIFNNGSRR